MDYHYDDEEMDEEDKASNTPWVKTNTTIDEFILWKKDTAPSQQDPRVYALNHWMEMAQTVKKKLYIFICMSMGGIIINNTHFFFIIRFMNPFHYHLQMNNFFFILWWNIYQVEYLNVGHHTYNHEIFLIDNFQKH